jgi:hypothetical protein
MTNEEKSPKKGMTASEYLRGNFHPADRVAVLVRNRHRGETTQRITTVEKVAAPQFQEWLRYKNEKEACDIYVGMNALKPESHTRTKDDILAIRHIYLDLDHEGPKSLAAIEESELVPRPNYVLSTSPDKFQVVWKVEEIAPERAEALQQAMAHEFDGDPAATDSSRVLRLPGFANKKYETDFQVRVHSHTVGTYHLRDFKFRTEPVEANHTRPNPSSQRSASSDVRPLSQSEHDWAYAKRALARGEAPEKIMHEIAEFRAHDKWDPEDYANRTVTKAQAELDSQPSSRGVGTVPQGESNREPNH